MTPTQLVADIAANSVRPRWAAAIKRPCPTAAARESLQTALNYLAARERVFRRNELAERRRKIALASREPAPLSHSIATPLTWAAFAILAALLFIKLVILFPQVYLLIALLVCVCTLWVFAEMLFAGSDDQPAFFTAGSGDMWKALQPSTTSDCAKEIQTVLTMMGPTAANIDPDAAAWDDPDIFAADDHPSPAMPGVVEFVLESDSTAVSEMRRELDKVRTFHRAVAAASTLIFFAGIIALLSAALTSTLHISTIGTLALLLGFLGWYSIKSWHDMRTSRIAVALFHSHVTELNLSLTAAAAERADLQTHLRHTAWRHFRIGLNELWLAAA